MKERLEVIQNAIGCRADAPKGAPADMLRHGRPSQELAVAALRLVTSLVVQNAEGKRELLRSVGYASLLHLLLPASALVSPRPLPAQFWAAAPEAELLEVDLGGRRASILPRLRGSRGDIIVPPTSRGRRTAMVDQTFGLQSVPSSAALVPSSASMDGLTAARVPSTDGTASGPVSAVPSASGHLAQAALATPTAAPASSADADGDGMGATSATSSARERSGGDEQRGAVIIASSIGIPIPPAPRIPELPTAAWIAAAQAAPASPWCSPWDGLVEAYFGLLLDDPNYTKAAASIGTEVVNNTDVIHVRMLRRASGQPGLNSNLVSLRAYVCVHGGAARAQTFFVLYRSMNDDLRVTLLEILERLLSLGDVNRMKFCDRGGVTELLKVRHGRGERMRACPC